MLVRWVTLTGPASRTPFVVAIFGSFAWAAICALYGYGNLWPSISMAHLRETLLQPGTPLLALAAMGPIFFMFGFAALSRRLRELRQSARAISQVAVRLAEPETMAGEHMATLTQAIYGRCFQCFTNPHAWGKFWVAMQISAPTFLSAPLTSRHRSAPPFPLPSPPFGTK